MLLHALVIATVVCLVLASALAFLLARMIRPRTALNANNLSGVSRQHFEIFQGESIDQQAVNRSRERFRRLLDKGEIRAAEALIRPGMGFVIHVHALTELGTLAAGRLLERQLNLCHSRDSLEQIWYWLDLATGLRSLNRTQALPKLVRLADQIGSDLPLSSYFAAEVSSFTGFGGLLQFPDHPLNPQACRVLRRALEGLRQGLEPARLAEARMGELVENHWDSQPAQDDPDNVRLLAEALRITRRLPAYEAFLPANEDEQEAWQLQAARLSNLEESIADYLIQCVEPLAARLPVEDPAIERRILLALHDIRADAARWLIPVLTSGRIQHQDLAIAVLARSHDEQTGRFLEMWVQGHIDVNLRAQMRRAPAPRPEDGMPFPYVAVLRSLRGHASAEVEELLLLAANDPEPGIRTAAVSSLGWQEPIALEKVRTGLAKARKDADPSVRFAARAALARLGERASLDIFRKGLGSQDPQQALLSIQAVAEENLTLLWPDVDARADASDAIVAHHAREALALLSEEAMPPRTI